MSSALHAALLQSAETSNEGPALPAAVESVEPLVHHAVSTSALSITLPVHGSRLRWPPVACGLCVAVFAAIVLLSTILFYL